MKLWFFWIFWGIDALICTIVVVFFLLGLADKWVSSFNIGIWIAILAALAVIIAGSLWLKAVGHPVFGTTLLLFLAIPGILSRSKTIKILIFNAANFNMYRNMKQ